jgi:hypothetical protein
LKESRKSKQAMFDNHLAKAKIKLRERSEAENKAKREKMMAEWEAD